MPLELLPMLCVCEKLDLLQTHQHISDTIIFHAIHNRMNLNSSDHNI